MTQPDIASMFSTLELAINQNDRDLIIECCDELSVHTEKLEKKLMCDIYNALAIAHLRQEHYLLSYRAIVKGLECEDNDLGQTILGLVKQTIIESHK